MQVILYLYHRCSEIIATQVPISQIIKLKLFDKLVQIKYDIPNDRLDMFDGYYTDIDAALSTITAQEA